MDQFAEITFAGFQLPRTENGPTIHNPTAKPNMAREYLADRLRKWKAHNKTRGCIGKVTYPNRIRSHETADTFKGWGCYLSSNGTLDDRGFSLRWRWVDEVPQGMGCDSWRAYGVDCGNYIDHTGWFIDDHEDEKIRGLIVKLPSGRGFLAGWSMGEGMATEIDCKVYQYCSDAIAAADSMAEWVAENEREYQADRCEECGEHSDYCECENEAAA